MSSHVEAVAADLGLRSEGVATVRGEGVCGVGLVALLRRVNMRAYVGAMTCFFALGCSGESKGQPDDAAAEAPCSSPPFGMDCVDSCGGFYGPTCIGGGWTCGSDPWNGHCGNGRPDGGHSDASKPDAADISSCQTAMDCNACCKERVPNELAAFADLMRPFLCGDAGPCAAECGATLCANKVPLDPACVTCMGGVSSDALGSLLNACVSDSTCAPGLQCTFLCFN